MNELVKSELLREAYYRIRHESGLEIYVFPKDLAVTYAILATRFGSVDNRYRIDGGSDTVEIPDGTAHFLEHKMFENEDGEDTFQKFARTGADANAFTSFRSTSYVFSCTGKLPESLEILLRSAFSPYFTDMNVKKEQGIIAQEIRMGEDDPNDICFRELLCCLYEKSSLRIDIAGSVESISRITPRLLYDCHSAFYNPRNMILCVCGRADPDEVTEVVRRVLSDRKPLEVVSLPAQEPPAVFRPRAERRMKVSKPLFCIGVKDSDISPSPAERMKKTAVMQLIASLYFGKSGEFYNRLYSDGLISPSFSCWSQHNSAFSFFTLSGDSDDPDRVFEAFSSHAAAIARAPVPREDFERCRRSLYSRFVKLFDSTEDIAVSLVTDFAVDGGDIFAYGEILRSLTAEDAERVLPTLFRPEAFAMSVVRPLPTDQ